MADTLYLYIVKQNEIIKENKSEFVTKLLMFFRPWLEF